MRVESQNEPVSLTAWAVNMSNTGARSNAVVQIAIDCWSTDEEPLDEGGRQIVIATDRRIGMREAQQQPRTIDYACTLIEIRLGSDGRGEGEMSLATKIALNTKTNTVELENYASEPVRLQNVKVEKF